MKRTIAAFVFAALAFPASAETIRDHVSTAQGEAAWGGREYVVMTRDPDRAVRVVEGAARWTGYRQTQIDQYRPALSPSVRSLFDIFE